MLTDFIVWWVLATLIIPALSLGPIPLEVFYNADPIMQEWALTGLFTQNSAEVVRTIPNVPTVYDIINNSTNFTNSTYITNVLTSPVQANITQYVCGQWYLPGAIGSYAGSNLLPTFFPSYITAKAAGSALSLLGSAGINNWITNCAYIITPFGVIISLWVAGGVGVVHYIFTSPEAAALWLNIGANLVTLPPISGPMQ